MMQRKNLLAALAFLLVNIDGVSAGIFGSFNFASLLYSVGYCKNIGRSCPPPPCTGPLHHPPICDYYTCPDDGSECTFGATQSMCNNNQQCMNSYDYYNKDADYYGDEDNSEVTSEGDDENYDADRSYIGEGSNGVNHNSQSVQANWMPYIVIGGVLTTLMLGIVWRKRNGIDNDELGEVLGPNDGRDLHGSVAKRLHHLEAGGQVPPPNSRLNTQSDFIPTGSNVEVDTSGYVMA